MRSQIVVLEGPRVLGWDHGPPEAPLTKQGQPVPLAQLVGVAVALQIGYPVDAHFVPYYLEGGPVCRINYGGLRALRAAGLRLCYDLLVLDLDPPGHAKDWTPEQILTWQRTTLLRLQSGDPDYWATCGWYTTRAGLRLLWELPGVDECAYVALHAATRKRLGQIGIVVDADTGEFNRIYRLPHATRDGVQL